MSCDYCDEGIVNLKGWHRIADPEGVEGDAMIPCPMYGVGAELDIAARNAWDYYWHEISGVEGATPEYTCMTVAEDNELERRMLLVAAALGIDPDA